MQAACPNPAVPHATTDSPAVVFLMLAGLLVAHVSLRVDRSVCARELGYRRFARERLGGRHEFRVSMRLPTSNGVLPSSATMVSRMPNSRTKPKSEPTADPDRLIRQADGGYRSSDERFAVEQANGSWFLADHETADDFGQPRVAGPFATLALVRDAIPRARSGPTPIRKPIKQAKRTAKPAPPQKPETWLDRLSTEDRRRAERLVRVLGKEGMPDAEDVARGRMEGKADKDLARRLLNGRIDRLLNDAEADETARQLVADAVRVLTAEGGRIGRDLPGWALVETDPDGSPTDRRIQLD